MTTEKTILLMTDSGIAIRFGDTLHSDGPRNPSGLPGYFTSTPKVLRTVLDANMAVRAIFFRNGRDHNVAPVLTTPGPRYRIERDGRVILE